MNGEKNLNTLLKNMTPVLNDEEYVFVTLEGFYGDYSHLKPLCSFNEKEGLTLIIPKLEAELHGMASDGVFKYITLEVHSSLNAVGLTAAVSARLADNEISANVVAAFYHDHIFVQAEHADRAFMLLKELSVQSLPENQCSADNRS